MRIILTLACLAALGCGHSRNVEPDKAASPTKEEAVDRRSAQAAKPAGASARKTADPSQPPAPVATATGGMPIVTSAAGLLEPGAARKIEQRLIDKGLMTAPTRGTLDGKAEIALRRFQKDQGLPETGMADKETLSKLGLPADEMLRKAGRTEK